MHLYIERPLCFPEFIYAFKGLKYVKMREWHEQTLDMHYILGER